MSDDQKLEEFARKLQDLVNNELPDGVEQTGSIQIDIGGDNHGNIHIGNKIIINQQDGSLLFDGMGNLDERGLQEKWCHYDDKRRSTLSYLLISRPTASAILWAVAMMSMVFYQVEFGITGLSPFVPALVFSLWGFVTLVFLNQRWRAASKIMSECMERMDYIDKILVERKISRI